MKKLILFGLFVNSLVFAQQEVQDTKETKKECKDAIYAIFHQSCALTLEQQVDLLNAEKCTTINEDKYFFYFQDSKVEFSIAPTCKLEVIK